ncbi:MAG: 6-hydroxymethylpterin diphosphokinase MptE-like protein [Polyangiaceae bacterium]
MSESAHISEDSLLGANLDFLAVPIPTRELIEAARPSELCQVAPGIFAVRHADGWLGLPCDETSIRNACVDAGRKPVVVFGLGSGGVVEQARAFAQAQVVVFEPDPGIARALLASGPSSLGDVDLVCSLHDLTQIWPSVAQGEAGATLVRTPGYREAFPEAHQALERALGELVQRTGMNQNTHRQRARMWVEDVLANAEVLTRSVPFVSLENKYRGVPAFIVGAGPSLGKNGKLLAEARQRGLVIAVNSSARALASYGVEPQVLCCIESIDLSELLASVPFIDRVVRAFSLSGHPRTMRTGNGPLLPVWEAIPEIGTALARLTGAAGLPVAGSVSTLAFSLAHRLGCSPIVLVGQDLAYTGNRAYAPGAAYERSSVEITSAGEIRIHWCDTVKAVRSRGAPPIHETEPLEPVTAWGGDGEVPSGPSFSAVRAWFETAAELLRRVEPEVELVNATEGGSRIRGFDELELGELVARLPRRDLTAERIASDALGVRAPLTPAELERWAADERERAVAVETAARAAERAAEQALRAMATGSPRRVNRSFAKLEAREGALRSAVAAAPMVDAWAFTPVDQALEHQGVEKGDAKASAEAGMRREIAVARAIRQSAGELSQALGDFERSARMTQEPGEGTPCPL